MENISFRCYYPDGGKVQHRQDLTFKQIMEWIAAYFFTHPKCEAITVKIWRESYEN